MNEKYKIAFDQINEGKYIEAYEQFSNILKNEPNDAFARFYRAILAFSYIQDKMNDTISDLEQLANSKNKYNTVSRGYLCIIYSNLELPVKSIDYGESIVKSDDEELQPLLMDIYFSLSKSYMMLGDLNSLEMALKCTNYCLEQDPDETQELYINKIDILSRMNKFDEAESELSNLYVKFGSSFSYYYISAELNILIFKAKQRKENLDKALSDVDIALQYEPKSRVLILLKSKIYSLMKEKDKAFEMLSLVKEDYDEEEYLLEQFNLYEEFEEYDKIIELSKNYLEKEESWIMYYTLAFFKAKSAVTKEEIIEVRDLYQKSYNIEKKIFIYNELYRLNFVLNEDSKNVELTKDIIDMYPKDGRLRYLLAESKHRLNYNYDEILECFEESFKLGFLDELRYYTMTIPLVEKPNKLYKHLRKYKKTDPNLLSPWMARKIGIRYLYGEEGYSKDLKMARKYLEHAYRELQDESCMTSTFGRLLEVEENYDEAFKMYLKAYELQKEELIPECNCANGYLAHAYINGIGTEKNIELAKKLILEGIDQFDDKSSNIVIYLYSYFALLGETEFKLEKSKDLLELVYPFYRYEITRPMMLKLVYKKLGLDTKKLDDIIWDCRWLGDSMNSKYYFKNRKKDIIYPAFNNY